MPGELWYQAETSRESNPTVCGKAQEEGEGARKWPREPRRSSSGGLPGSNGCLGVQSAHEASLEVGFTPNEFDRFRMNLIGPRQVPQSREVLLYGRDFRGYGIKAGRQGMVDSQ